MSKNKAEQSAIGQEEIKKIEGMKMVYVPAEFAEKLKECFRTECASEAVSYALFFYLRHDRMSAYVNSLEEGVREGKVNKEVYEEKQKELLDEVRGYADISLEEVEFQEIYKDIFEEVKQGNIEEDENEARIFKSDSGEYEIKRWWAIVNPKEWNIIKNSRNIKQIKETERARLFKADEKFVWIPKSVTFKLFK